MSQHRKLTLEKKFFRRSCRDSNPRPFDHESGALTTELSPLSWALMHGRSLAFVGYDVSGRSILSPSDALVTELSFLTPRVLWPLFLLQNVGECCKSQ